MIGPRNGVSSYYQVSVGEFLDRAEYDRCRHILRVHLRDDYVGGPTQTNLRFGRRATAAIGPGRCRGFRRIEFCSRAVANRSVNSGCGFQALPLFVTMSAALFLGEQAR